MSTVLDVLSRRAQYALLCEDMRVFLPTVPDESIELIVTDPPYDTGANWMFFFLYEQAWRLLKPGGHYITITPQYLLDPFASQLRDHVPEGWTPPGRGEFRLRWTMQMRQAVGPHPRLVNPDRNLEVCGKNLSLYTKLPLPQNDYRGFRDAFDSVPIPKADRLHKWQQSLEWAEYCVDLAPEGGGGVILDPLMGVGTVGVATLNRGHRFIGCDIDPEVVAIARERIGREVL